MREDGLRQLRDTLRSCRWSISEAEWHHIPLHLPDIRYTKRLLKPCLQVHLVERIPFFDALYFVTTTLTTVGYGDVVAVSIFGKAAVLAMILVGVVLIPVQTSQLYAQLTARRLTLGQ